MKKIIFLLCLAISLAQCKTSSHTNVSEAGIENSLLWEIKKPGNNHASYLFGTFHLLCKEDIKLSDSLKIYLSKSQKVFLEMDMDDPSILKNLMRFMAMNDGVKLIDLYNDDQYARLTSFFKDSLHMSVQAFQQMKPALLEVFLYQKMMDCKTSEGMESEIMQQAKKYNLSIDGLETLTEQAAVFDSIPYKQQALEFIEKIDSLDKYKKEFTKAYTAYLHNDLKALDLTTSIEKDSGFLELLLWKRNKNWVSKLNGLLPSENLLIAVGAGHLPGDYGLITLLRKEGYFLRPVKN